MIAFHGTNQDFDIFDADMLGASSASSSSRIAYFFAASRETAIAYARSAANKLVPNQRAHETQVADLLRESRIAEDKGDWDLAEELMRQAEKLDLDRLRADPANACILEVRLSFTNPLEVDATHLPIATMDEVLEEALGAGHDAVLFRGIRDIPSGLAEPDDHIAIFDPSCIEILARHEIDLPQEDAAAPQP